MAEAMEISPFHEEWDQFFQLDDQESLLAAAKDVSGCARGQDSDSTSPSIPSLEFHCHSAGNSSPSEIDTFTAQFSPVYQLPPAMESPPLGDAPNPKKRKTAEGGAAANGTRQPRGQKISHNVIEKRYRSNLNDKIAKLRDSVPELRTAAPTVKRRPPKAHASDSEGSGDEGAGLKFNKATVLVKATEYIQQLERQNQKLQSELSVLRNRTGPVERLRNPPAISTAVIDYATPARTYPKAPSTAGSTTANEQASPTDTLSTSPGLIRVPDDVRRLRDEAKPEQHYAASLAGFAAESEPSLDLFNQPVQGMIPLPESFRRLREEAAAQDHYAPESSYYSALSSPDELLVEEEDGESVSWPRSKALSRVLVGSLAGLMVMEGFSEKEETGPGTEKRGLFSLPTELMTESRGFRAQIRGRILNFAASSGAKWAIPLLIATAVLFCLSFVVFIYLAPKRAKSRRAITRERTRSPDPRAPAAQSPAPETSPGPTLNRTYSPPPDAMLQSEPLTWDMQLIERLTMEWFGLSEASHGIDEESTERAAKPRRELAALRHLIGRIFLQRSPS